MICPSPLWNNSVVDEHLFKNIKKQLVWCYSSPRELQDAKRV